MSKYHLESQPNLGKSLCNHTNLHGSALNLGPRSQQDGQCHDVMVEFFCVAPSENGPQIQ